MYLSSSPDHREIAQEPLSGKDVLKIVCYSVEEEESSQRYILNFENGKQLRVSEFTLQIFQIFDGKTSLDDIALIMKERFGADDGYMFVNGFIGSYLIPLGLLENHPRLPGYRKTKQSNPNYFIISRDLPIYFRNGISRLSRNLKFMMRKSVFASFTILLSICCWIMFNSIIVEGLEPLDFSFIPISYLILLISVFIHELGHLSAAESYGHSPQSIGIGISFFFSGIYCNLRSIWNLSRRKRIVIDLAGIYFQVYFALVIIIYSWLTTSPQLIYVALYIFYIVVFNLNFLIPISDGYWIIADLSDSSNLRRDSMISIKELFTKRKVGSRINVLYGFVSISMIVVLFFITLLMLPDMIILLDWSLLSLLTIASSGNLDILSFLNFSLNIFYIMPIIYILILPVMFVVSYLRRRRSLSSLSITQ